MTHPTKTRRPMLEMSFRHVTHVGDGRYGGAGPGTVTPMGEWMRSVALAIHVEILAACPDAPAGGPLAGVSEIP